MILDNITYTHRLSNFIEAKNQALKLAGLLKNGLKMQDGNMDIDIGAILTNLGSPEMRSIEEFVLKHLSVIDENGEPVLIQDAAKFNTHFNRHRAHYFQMMFDGLKFHFADFLPAGVASVPSMNLAGMTPPD